MFIKETISKRKAGDNIVYLQLVESIWDSAKGVSKHHVVHTLGRKDKLDVAKLERLAKSISKYIQSPTGRKYDHVSGSKRLSFLPLLDGLWRKLKIDQFVHRALKSRNFEIPLERILFALIAHRIYKPASKLACEHWVNDLVFLHDLSHIEVQQIYRAMDFLYDHGSEFEKALYFQLNDLLELDLSIVFYDTTAFYFEIDEPDGEGGLRRRGHPKGDNPGHLPQVVVGLAINRSGIPIRHWVWPGNTSDVTTVQEVLRDLSGLRPRRFFFVGDRGMISQENINYLESRGLKYILGVKLRNNPTIEKLLSQRGRYRQVDEQRQIRETKIMDGDREMRYILSRYHPTALRDKTRRTEILAYLEQELKRDRAPNEGSKWFSAMRSHKVYGRYLKVENGRLAIDQEKVKSEERLDGKYIVMTNDFEMDGAELEAGYRELCKIEHSFETMKGTLDTRPMYHRIDVRIRTHIQLCVIAYALLRTCELKTGKTWMEIERTLDSLTASTVHFTDGTMVERGDVTEEMKEIFNKVGVPVPPRVLTVRG